MHIGAAIRTALRAFDNRGTDCQALFSVAFENTSCWGWQLWLGHPDPVGHARAGLSKESQRVPGCRERFVAPPWKTPLVLAGHAALRRARLSGSATAPVRAAMLVA